MPGFQSGTQAQGEKRRKEGKRVSRHTPGGFINTSWPKMVHFLVLTSLLPARMRSRVDLPAVRCQRLVRLLASSFLPFPPCPAFSLLPPSSHCASLRAVCIPSDATRPRPACRRTALFRNIVRVCPLFARMPRNRRRTPISTHQQTPRAAGQLQRRAIQRRLAALGKREPEVLAVDGVSAGKAP